MDAPPHPPPACGADAPSTLRDALRAAQARGMDRLDAQWLLLHALGRPLADRAWLLAHDDTPLAPEAAARYAALCQRRIDGEPLAYLTGERGFYGLTLRVDARVLDPRPDTETLVDWALAVLPAHAGVRVVDLGTGSGAIALALQHARPDAAVWGLDQSADALTVAAANGRRLGLPVRWVQGRWWSDWRPWPGGADDAGMADAPPWPARFDLIVANPPYLRADDPHLDALRHEPIGALVGGADGLDDLRAIVAGAPARLEPGGWLLLEHGWDQAEAVAALLQQGGWRDIDHRRDLGGHRRCTGGRWPG
ncbi:protein-(glutamine-N5) methyltransferase, release factor-specific [Tepidimonas fonticaldi]|uniref:Release factor glutamine methyltransferase n=1 Tax=Tepidimonas fonticaldi TaxID=1101373 RepID=A0A1A6DU26_9BURK|nr:peptide chain release factor N(5)-glutamine methyltransferase [Tepidimonas fonticaldi]OBS30176.1 protein-(glutamine-N5) methyltransferase, release factor-specific [Tepidimonas fonticaldi]